MVSRRFTVSAEAAEAFAFFSDPQRLNEVTPAWFQVVPRGDLQPELTVGSEVDYSMRWHRIPLRWRSLITEWRPPVLITYEQARGPYRSFRHEHQFIERQEGVEIVDTISFTLPFAQIFEPIGRLLVEPVVRKQLENILDVRAATSAAILAASGGRF